MTTVLIKAALALSVLFHVSAFDALAQNETSVEIHLPTRISEAELESAKFYLALSQAQAVVLDRMYANYVEQWEQLTQSHGSDLRRVGVSAAPLFLNPTGQFGWDAVEAFERIEKLRTALLDRYAAADAGLWTQLQPLLSEEQTVRLGRLSMQRARDRCRLTNREIHGSRIDLVRLLRRQLIEATPGTELDFLLAEYDLAITSPWLLIESKYAKLEPETLAVAVELLFSLPAPTGRPTRAGQTYAQSLTAMKKPVVTLQRRIITLNNLYLSRLREVLAPDEFKVLEQFYRSIAYPSLYPDPLDPASLRDSIITLPGINDESRNLMQAAWLRYQETYRAINQRMERLEDEWWEYFALTRTTADFVAFREQMQALRDLRWQANRGIVIQMRDLLVPVDRDAVQPMTNDYLAKHDRIVARAADVPWPR